MNYNFDQIIERRGTDSVKWHAYGENILPLWVADMDFVSPEPVRQALLNRIEHGIFGYPYEAQQLRQVIVQWIDERYAWQVQPEWLVLVPGVVTGFNMAAHMLGMPGGEVLVQTPVYPPMLHAAELAGMTTRCMQLTRGSDGQYFIDWDEFEACLSQQTRMFLLCNPHNPTGRVFRIDELERMAQICTRKGVLICSDEIHCDLIFNGHKHIPIAAMDGEVGRHSITLMAPSKTFNIAGLEFSIAVIPDEELRKSYEKARAGLVSWPNLLGGVAALAAYQGGLEWLDQVLVYLQANRDFTMAYINHEIPGIHMAEPEGTYLAWLDCRELGREIDPYKLFLDVGVGLNDGRTFGPGGEGFVRLNFACPRSTLSEALERMKRVL